MQDMTIVGEIDYAVSTIVGYLQKDEIYYVHGSRFGSFVRWDDVRMPDVDIPDDQVLEEASILRTQTSQDLLIIMNRSLDPELRAQHNLTFLTQFTGSIVDDEGFLSVSNADTLRKTFYLTESTISDNLLRVVFVRRYVANGEGPDTCQNIEESLRIHPPQM